MKSREINSIEIYLAVLPTSTYYRNNVYDWKDIKQAQWSKARSHAPLCQQSKIIYQGMAIRLKMCSNDCCTNSEQSASPLVTWLWNSSCALYFRLINQDTISGTLKTLLFTQTIPRKAQKASWTTILRGYNSTPHNFRCL